MSLASYIGCNIVLPISKDEYSDDSLYIGGCFAGEEELQSVKKHQFTTPYVYEISSHWGIEILKEMNKKTRARSKRNLLELCKRMDGYLEKGDYFELYSCWVGEEDDKRVGELNLQMNNFDIDLIEIPEKTLVRFQK